MQHFTASEIQAGAKTVIDLATYLDELKTAATSFAEQGKIAQRGYFSADEDDMARRLLVSYWTSRNALFELILDFRKKITDLSQASMGEFVVPFGAALLLIDAARFLRELAEGNPIVRRKFNEPASSMGIPGGTYDTVQRSLLSARHAWHLFHASKFYEQNRESFRAANVSRELKHVQDVIDRLSHRLDISLSRFARSKLRTRGDQWLRYLGRTTLQRALYGLQKLAASLMADVYVRPGHSPGIPNNVRSQITDHLRPGDVLLVRKEYALTNYFLPGYWPHVALFLGDSTELRSQSRNLIPSESWHRFADDSDLRVLESMKDGVFIRPLYSPFASDSIIALRPKLESASIWQAIQNALTHEGKPYDFDFDFRRSDRLVCTEVVYRGYEGVGSAKFDLVHRAGRPTLSGHDLVSMSLQNQIFEPVMAFVPGLHDSPELDLVTAKDVIEETLQRNRG